MLSSTELAGVEPGPQAHNTGMFSTVEEVWDVLCTFPGHRKAAAAQTSQGCWGDMGSDGACRLPELTPLLSQTRHSSTGRSHFPPTGCPLGLWSVERSTAS